MAGYSEVAPQSLQNSFPFVFSIFVCVYKLACLATNDRTWKPLSKQISNVAHVININCHSEKMVLCLKPLEVSV